MFIGRERELAELNRMYQTDRFQFPVIYGRRRVGKTALINEFLKDKEAIYFTGVETNEKQNLENFSKSILNYGAGMEADFSFGSFQAALEYVFRLAENERVILVIDEYPYVAKASESLASTLQLLIDKYKDTSKLYLILCGSSMSFMENHVLAYKAPLYGRRTAQFKIEPFDFFEARTYFKDMDSFDQALMYGIVGGTPQYMLQMNPALSVEENVKAGFLNPNAILYEEPNNLLKQEVREPAIYTAIISAIASGYSKMSEISGKVGEDTSVCTIYVKNLISLGIVRRETPFGEESSRKTIYAMEDPMFRFWYRFVLENQSVISRGMADLAYRRIEPYLHNFMGSVFEEICKQYLWRLLMQGKSAVDFTDLGRYWGTNPKTRKQFEIDIMGTAGKDTALFAECKWRNEKVDLEVLETLLERGEMFSYKKKHYYVFSKSGFTKGCEERAEELGNVTLVAYEKMLEHSF